MQKTMLVSRNVSITECLALFGIDEASNLKSRVLNSKSTIQLSEFTACHIANDLHSKQAPTLPLSSRFEHANLRQDPHREDDHPRGGVF